MPDYEEDQIPDDATIVKKMMDFNEEGMRELLKFHGGYAIDFARSRLKRLLKGDGLMQALYNGAFVVWTNAHRFDHSSSLRTWFTRYVYWAGLDLIAPPRHPEVSLSQMSHDELLSDHDDDSSNWALDEVMAAVETLPESQKRTIMIDLSEDGLTDREKAEILGITVGTFHKNRCNGLKQLRELLVAPPRKAAHHEN